LTVAAVHEPQPSTLRQVVLLPGAELATCVSMKR
jgi:hypothetical protein